MIGGKPFLILDPWRGRAEEAGLRERILQQLRSLEFEALELCVCRLLSECGYQKVQMLGRRQFVGRNRAGGADIGARIATPTGLEKVLIQVKQYSVPVSKRAVDELRGVLLREDCQQGVLVSTSAFSPLALSAARRVPLLPVRCIGGSELADLCVRYRIGVVESSLPVLTLDEQFFDKLTEEATLGSAHN